MQGGPACATAIAARVAISLAADRRADPIQAHHAIDEVPVQSDEVTVALGHQAGDHAGEFFAEVMLPQKLQR